MRRSATLVLALAALLAGCVEQLGIETPAALAAKREVEGKAIGGACRHAGRAIEDCYTLNKRADKAAVFAGWREMNDYMRENKIEPVAPQLGNAPKPAPAQGEDDEVADSKDKAPETKVAEARPAAAKKAADKPGKP